MQDLIARLEGAFCPDWMLDAEIARLDFYREAHGDCADDEVPPFTDSIDAALTLVPEGFRWKLGYSHFVPCVAEVVDYRDTPTVAGTFYAERDDGRAIALCIAALKARASLAGPPHP